MNFLTKVKNDMRLMLGFSAGGAALFGIGLTGMITSPSYHYIVAGLDHSWSSESEANKWIENNIDTLDSKMYEVSFDHFIPEDEIDEYITKKYASEFDADAWYTSGSYTVDADGKLETTVVFSRTLESVYETATGSGEFDIDIAALTWVESETKYGSEFATTYATQFDTRALAEAHWLDEKVNRNTFDSRDEYYGDGTWFTTENEAKDDIANAHTIIDQDEFKYMGEAWDSNQSIARDRAIQNEEAKVDHTEAIIAVPNEEADYQLTSEYAIDRDAWIIANTTPEDATDPDNIIPEVVPTETDYLASAEYTTELDAWLLANPNKVDPVDEYWTYNGIDYATKAESTAAVEVVVDATEENRTMYSHDGSDFSFSTEAAARAAYRNTLDPSERVRWAYNGSDFDYDTWDDAEFAFVQTLNELAAVTSQEWYRATGVNVDAWSKDKASIEAQIKTNMPSKDAITGETVAVYDDYNLSEIFFYEENTLVAYDSLANLITAYKAVEWADLEDMLVIVVQYSLKGNDHLFDDKEEAIAFWKSLVQEVKK